MRLNGLMKGATLPGNSTVVISDYPIPTPGHGEVLIRMKASTICGSDIRAIYREHIGSGPEAYQGVIAGHEPCGSIVEVGPGVRRFQPGDRVIVYHISGCGVCNDCRRGYMISCTSKIYRRAYGWQRDGGMADYLLAEEKDLVFLPDELTYLDGAQVACGFGTIYEGIGKIGISGDYRVLVTGLGPVGLGALMLAKAMGATLTIGIDHIEERLALARSLGLADHVLMPNEATIPSILELTHGRGCERSIECSGSREGRTIAVKAAAKWSRIVFIGEGGELQLQPSADMIHDQKTIFGSWVTSIWRMEELVERLVRWNLHPQDLVTHTFPLNEIDDAYRVMESGRCGKVAIVFD